jgi:lysyl-tRNA synthetase class 2
MLKEQRLKNLKEYQNLVKEPLNIKKENFIKNIVMSYIEGKSVSLAGRVIAIRVHGKTAFLDIWDFTGKIQIYIKKEKIGENQFRIYELLDIGDIIGVSGSLFKTKTGEVTVFAENISILTKALLPLPEKWHGLQDIDIRYRKRYLDIISNQNVRETFFLRTKIIRKIRTYLDEKGFIEVETPMMHPVPGGATAKPFVTHHNALDIDLYLRIAPELYLKRLLVAGMDKIYEINRNFRNEGISTVHNPEFTMMEIYHSYADYNDMMTLTEDLISNLVTENLLLEKSLPQKRILKYGETEIDFTRPWKKKAYTELLKEQLDLEISDFEKAKDIAKKGQIEAQGKTHIEVVNDIFEKYVEPTLISPTFVVDYPYELCPLAKKKESDSRVCERFELFIAGMEIANAFSELNDPIEQRQRFENQLKKREDGMVKIDEDFIEALEYGMPPAGGLGIGIDRLVMVLTNNKSIREVILFPTLREKPQQCGPSGDTSGDSKSPPKLTF